jgi:two-component system sensor histidine kinase AlgZ
MHPILGDRRRLQLHLVAFGLVGLMLAGLVHALLGSPWPHALAFGVPLGLVAAPVSISAWYVCRAMPLSLSSLPRVVVTALTSALGTALIWAAIGRGWWLLLSRAGLGVPGASMAALAALLVGLGALAYLLALMIHYLLQAFEESAELARRALESQIAQRDAELRALRAQVDPHFLFNSLNSIAGLVAPDPERARRMCQLLGDFLRDSLALGAAVRIALGREVALAEQYLRVEQVRFGHRLDVRATVEPESAAVSVPPLILQPLVENAVRHGIATRLDGGLVEIAARRAGDLAVIVVTNPCDPDASRHGMGLGVDLVRRRLGASFGNRAALVVEPAPESYRVVLTIPIDGGEALA